MSSSRNSVSKFDGKPLAMREMRRPLIQQQLEALKYSRAFRYESISCTTHYSFHPDQILRNAIATILQAGTENDA